MRTFKSPLAGVVIVALLLSMTATAVLAQDDEPSPDPPDFVFVTGEEVNGACGQVQCTAQQVMSDPRVSGELVVQLDLGCSDEMICWMRGGLTISNDGGAWDGRWVGFINDGAPGGRSHDMMQWLEGSGVYEGWSYVAVLSDLDRPLRDVRDVRGVFHRGDLPLSVAQGLVSPAE